jgi:hypothetical protein
MPVPSRLDRYIETDKQKHFLRDFMVGWEAYETWDQAAVGQSGIGQRSFEIREEDILDYNRACGETDPVMVDPAYARKNSPTGELLQHPVFVTTIAFFSLGEKGIGTWIRTAGARNPQQRIEIIEPFRYGEIIVASPICRCCWSFTMSAALSRRAGGVRSSCPRRVPTWLASPTPDRGEH